jgi:mono/diheme cytochrome c family protein
MKTIGKSSLGFAALLVCAASCASARRGEPIVAGGKPPLNAEEQLGQRVFMRECNSCHPGGEGGVGPAINNKPVPAAAIRLQVRNGLGAMPAFDDGEVSDAELSAIISYLTKVGAPWD